MKGASFLLELVAITGATVHSPPAAPHAATVLIDGERIRAVGPEVAIPADARRIDATGMHLVPGLIDGFAYFDPDHDELYTAAGVTTVRDHGNDLATILVQRERAARDRVPGPWLSISGAVIDGTPPSTSSALIAQSDADAAAIVAKLEEVDVDFFAFQSNLGLDPWRKLVNLAHAGHRTLWGPVPRAATLAEALAGLQDGVLFLDGFVPAGKSWEDFDIAAAKALASEMAQARTAIVPMLAGLARLIDAPEARRQEIEYLSPQYNARWFAEYAVRKKLLEQQDYVPRTQAVLGKQRALVAALFAAGVRIVPGSGAPHPWLMPGTGLVRELGELEAAGIAPSAVLALATSGAASVLGIEDRGTIAPGRIADLVLVRSDPEARISALAEVEGVCVRGRWLTRADIDRELEELRARQRRAVAEALAPLPVQDPALDDGTGGTGGAGGQILIAGYSESAVDGMRVAGEKWRVARDGEGGLVFAGRRLTPGTAEHADADVEIRQRLVGDRLETFEIHLRTPPRGDKPAHDLAVRGKWVGDELQVERTLDGRLIEIERTKEAIAGVDVDSVTTFMLLGHHESRRTFPMLRFYTGLKLEVVYWQQSPEPQNQRLFRTPSGGKLAAFSERGALTQLVLQQGSGLSVVRTLELDASGGGLTLSALAPASEPAPGEQGPPAPVGPPAGGGGR